jgi:hypothetical protein
MMNNFFGPYCKDDNNPIWHWKKDCPDFPQVENPEWMISNKAPAKKYLCKKCMEIQLEELELKHKEIGRN